MTFRTHILPAALVFALAVGVVIPSALSLPQHGDERQYIWAAAYFGGKVTHLDFRPAGTDAVRDPGWSPSVYWTVTQPMGARFVYALALWITQSSPPELPYSFGDPALQGVETEVTPHTLLVCRLTAILCAALGLALVAVQFRWAGAVTAAVFLLIPHVPSDLARAWAEGPLLLGFGLCAVTWRTRWFAPMCGLAATFKLTGLPLWLLAFRQGFGGSRIKHIAAVLVSAVVWVALTPPSWFFGGPLFLWLMLADRAREHSIQAGLSDSLIPSFFLPTRYLWPLELAAILAITLVVSRFVIRLWRVSDPS